MSQPLVSEDLVVLDLETTDRVEATRHLATTLLDSGRITDIDGFLADVAAREEQMATGLPGGIAIPHCRSPHVAVPSLGFARSEAGIDWGAADGPAHLIFLIAVPEGGDQDHLAILAKLARKLMKRDFKRGLLTTSSASGAVDLLDREVVQA